MFKIANTFLLEQTVATSVSSSLFIHLMQMFYLGYYMKNCCLDLIYSKVGRSVGKTKL